jgi:hypothetical protein
MNSGKPAGIIIFHYTQMGSGFAAPHLCVYKYYFPNNSRRGLQGSQSLASKFGALLQGLEI